jgi:hypothetical protein
MKVLVAELKAIVNIKDNRTNIEIKTLSKCMENIEIQAAYMITRK